MNLKRWHCYYKGKLIRVLAWANYERCAYGEFPKEFVRRLPDDDPRPRGRHLGRGKYSEGVAAWYAALPVGQWLQVGD